MIFYIHEEFVDANRNRIKAEVTAVIIKENVRFEQRCGSHFQHFLNIKYLKNIFYVNNITDFA